MSANKTGIFQINTLFGINHQATRPSENVAAKHIMIIMQLGFVALIFTLLFSNGRIMVFLFAKVTVWV